MTYKRKLIEVALPLEAINRESAREKSIRHGHPSTLHLWWARRPLAACRAVLFAQLVDDPSAHPDKFPTEQAQAVERRRLFDLIERLVVWENSGNEALFKQAHDEIASCFEGKLPVVLDPFAGGGSIPLEAQRLGLEAHASDLNPVAVLINKALIEIPPKWTGRPRVFPGAAGSRLGSWPRSTGLAEDVRRYGDWVHQEAVRRIGHMYPKATLPDLSHANVLAWIWTRTVTCPNPACGIGMPLVQSWWLGKKKGREAYVVPRVDHGRVEFDIGHDVRCAPTKENDGTVRRTGAVCVGCGTAVPLAYIRVEGKAGRIGARLMAVAAEGNRRRLYLPPTPEHEKAADVPVAADVPDTEIPHNPRYLTTPNYGMTRHADLFTPRQLTALITFSDLVGEAREVALADAVRAGMSEGRRLEAGGTDAASYADTIGVYLALTVSRLADWSNALCGWESTGQVSQHLFVRQTISMVWNYSEAFVLGNSSGSFSACLTNLVRALAQLGGSVHGAALQADARTALRASPSTAVSTDPPYYDNVPYADLSDVFYIWLRRCLRMSLPSLMGTLVTPKSEELVADPQRQGGKEAAAAYFEAGFRAVFQEAHKTIAESTPITVYYAFKQAESDLAGTVSTGWETLLDGMVTAEWMITATWPIRTQMASRVRGQSSNALASSIVLALRPRARAAQTVTRRGFLAALKTELPDALRVLQQGSIAPVDLAQAAIGPGMAIFSRHNSVVEADGSRMTVRTALALINHALDEVLAEQEGDFDADTRFCVKWFTQFGWDDADFGHADQLSRSTNTSVDGLVRGGVFWARAGRARLVALPNLSDGWNPLTDDRVSVWEAVVRLAKVLDTRGGEEAARLLASVAQRVDLDAAKELAYLLFSICEKKKLTDTALLLNGLGTSWSDLSAAARAGGSRTPPPAPDVLPFAGTAT